MFVQRIRKILTYNYKINWLVIFFYYEAEHLIYKTAKTMLLPMVFYTKDVYDNKASFANMRRNFSQQNNFKQTSEPKKEKIEVSH